MRIVNQTESLNQSKISKCVRNNKGAKCQALQIQRTTAGSKKMQDNFPSQRIKNYYSALNRRKKCTCLGGFPLPSSSLPPPLLPHDKACPGRPGGWPKAGSGSGTPRGTRTARGGPARACGLSWIKKTMHLFRTDKRITWFAISCDV